MIDASGISRRSESFLRGSCGLPELPTTSRHIRNANEFRILWTFLRGDSFGWTGRGHPRSGATYEFRWKCSMQFEHLKQYWAAGSVLSAGDSISQKRGYAYQSVCASKNLVYSTQGEMVSHRCHPSKT
jgi:hypothetical protein